MKNQIYRVDVGLHLNLICVCAFLNMFIQTKGLDKLIQWQNSFLQEAGFINGFNKKILFHRYNLLKLIELVSRHLGTLHGKREVLKNNYKNSGKFCLALSLLNQYSHYLGQLIANQHILSTHTSHELDGLIVRLLALLDSTSTGTMAVVYDNCDGQMIHCYRKDAIGA